MSQKNIITETLTIPPELKFRLTEAQTTALQECWSKNFVTPFIMKKIGDELSVAIPRLQKTLNTAFADIGSIYKEYGLVFVLLEKNPNAADSYKNLIQSICDLDAELEHLSNKNALREMCGNTNGNRSQVEVNHFIFSIAEILKTQKGVPWGDVASIVLAQIHEDQRLRGCLPDQSLESLKELLRKRYERRKLNRT